MLSKVLYLHISCVLIEHICGSDALHRYLATGDGEVLWFLLTISYHANLHLRVLGSFQAFHRLLVGHALAYERFVVDAYYLIARYDARLLCWTVGNNCLYVYGVLADYELYAHAEERSLQVVGGQLHVLGTDIDGVRVEFGKYLRHGLFNE